MDWLSSVTRNTWLSPSEVPPKSRNWRTIEELRAILLSPLVGQDLYEIGKALWDLSDLAQYVKRVCKVRGHPRGDESMVRRGRGLSGLPEDKCGGIYADLKFLRKHC